MNNPVDDEVLAMAESGLTPGAIAEQTGLDLQKVYTILRNNGRAASAHRQTLESRIGAQKLDDLFRRYEAGEPVSKLIEEHELDYNRFYALLRRYDITPRRRRDDLQEARQARLDHAVRLYQDGALITAIELETGVAQPQLHKELRRRKVELRRGSSHD